MPHICTRCNSVFVEGVDILQGCPVCGWKKFLFIKSKEDAKKVKQTLDSSDTNGGKEPWPEKGSLDKILKSSPSKRTSELSQKRIKNKIVESDLSACRVDNNTYPLSPDAGVEELNREDGEIVESIRISEPGTYVLNLPGIFEREELVMSVKEGTYLIDLPSAFKKYKKD